MDPMQPAPSPFDQPAPRGRIPRPAIRPPWALLAVGVAGLALAWRWRQRRKGRIKRGEIRPLHHCWHTTADGLIHSRQAQAAQTSANPPLVLIHGMGVSSAYFLPLAERLAVEFPVYVPELPGHGLSDPPLQPMTISRMADALIRWMDTLGLTEVLMIGNSMGCQTVVEAALRYPDRIRGIVLLGPHEPSGHTLAHYLIRLLLDLPFIHPALIPVALRDWVRMGRHLRPELRLLLQDQVPCELPKLGTPTLLVRGQRDTLAPRAWIEEASRLLGGAPVVEIPRWGHAVHYSAAFDVARAIRPFLLHGRRTADARLSDQRQPALPRPVPQHSEPEPETITREETWTQSTRRCLTHAPR